MNFLSIDRIDLIEKVGSISGKEVNKFKKFDTKYFKGIATNVPLLEDSIVILECKLENTFKVGDHAFFVGRIINALVREGALEDELIDVNKVKFAYYCGKDKFITVDPKTLAVTE